LSEATRETEETQPETGEGGGARHSVNSQLDRTTQGVA
jgi:hypothetical protein